MTTILATYDRDPGFPPTDQRPGATRTLIGSTFVDGINGTPTQADLDAYNAPSPAQIRHDTFIADPVRIDFVTHFKNDTLAQIDTYVRGKINADAAVDLATARACLKRIENALVGLSQTIGLIVRE